MLWRVLAVLAEALVVKVVFSVVIGYRHYLPPNFDAEFLLGREAYFWGIYAWAFYAHLVAGPVSLLLGMILIGSRMRSWSLAWHRRLGRALGMCVLLVLVPSGLVMARHAATGALAGFGLGLLALATAACVLLGWKAAVQQRIADHRRWMMRTYVLLLSAVVIRLLGGLATVAGMDALWVYPLSCWTSWLGPLMVFEAVRVLRVPQTRTAVFQRIGHG